jgi:hypothetical protein
MTIFFGEFNFEIVLFDINLLLIEGFIVDEYFNIFIFCSLGFSSKFYIKFPNTNYYFFSSKFIDLKILFLIQLKLFILFLI